MKLSYRKLMPLMLALLISSCSTTKEETESILKKEFKDHYLIGTALNSAQILGKDEKTNNLVRKHFNTITPENILKWGLVHPELNKYNFKESDEFVEFGKRNNMFIVGHVLIWHQQTPNWVFENEDGTLTNRKTLLNRMKDHIFSVAGRYKDKIDGWDVLNEAIEDNGEMRKTKWLDIIGTDFIDSAFVWANQAAPNCELYYNDFNMWEPKKVETVVKLVKSLQEKGIRIDGIGMQAHWGIDHPSIDLAEEAIIAYEKLGVKIMITELDLTVLPFPGENVGADITKSADYEEKYNAFSKGLPKEVNIKAAERYTQIFSLFNKYSKTISRVTFWGTYDGMSWRNNWPIRGRTDYPLIFDRNHEPKLAFDEIVKTVSK